MGYSTGNFTVLGDLLADRKGERLSVIDLGSQDVKIFDPSDLETLIRFVTDRGGDASALRRTVGTSFPTIITARDVFLAANLDYTCCDVDRRPGTIYVDYTTHTFDPANYGKYDLVLNAGTTEHLATPVAALLLMHYLCKTGGILFNEVPLAGWMNHGLNNLTPKFWHTLRWMNSYDVLRAEAKYAIVSKADDGNFGGAHLDFIDNLADSGKVSSSIQIIFRKVSPRGFIVPYDAVIPTDDGGEAIWKLVIGSLHPYVMCGSLGPDDAVEAANAFMEYQGLPYRNTINILWRDGRSTTTGTTAMRVTSMPERQPRSLSAAAVASNIAQSSKATASAGLARLSQIADWRENVGSALTGINLKQQLADHQQLGTELETYKHALETTATDRDRISRELDQYRYAFETTTTDRDRLAAENAALTEELAAYRHALDTTVTDRDRMAAWHEHLRAMSDPLDAGFIRLDFQRLSTEAAKDEAEALIAHWTAAMQAGDHKSIVDSALADVHARPALPFDAGQNKALAAYYLATLLSWRGRYDEIYPLLADLDFGMPPDGADFLPFDLKQGTRAVASWQALALERNAPSALIVSIWKSASAHVAATIRQVFDVPVVRVSIGEGSQAVAVTKWLQQLELGGAVTHDHFPACLSLQQLVDAGVKRVFVQVRDPRDVAFSSQKMAEDFQALGIPTVNPGGTPGGEASQQFIHAVRAAADWIADWASVPNQELSQSTVALTFIHYHDVVNDLAGVFRTVFGDRFDDAAQQRLAVLQGASKDGHFHGANFRKGTGGEWRKVYSKAVCDAAFDAIPDDVKTLLALER